MIASIYETGTKGSKHYGVSFESGELAYFIDCHNEDAAHALKYILDHGAIDIIQDKI